MARDPDELLREVLTLPRQVRARVAARLIDSLEEEGEPDEQAEALWGQEVQRRVEDLDAGRVGTVSREEALRRIRGKA